MNTTRFLRRTVVSLSALAAMVIAASAAQAAELPVGTVISAKNLEQVKKDSFEGKPIESMLSPALEQQVLKHNLKIRLAKSTPFPGEARIAAATQKYAKDVKYDPATKLISGYTAGVPFPAIDAKDPNAGGKVLWNFVYGNPAARTSRATNATFLYIDPKKGGIEKQSLQSYERAVAKGSLGANPLVSKDPNERARTLIVFESPEDIRGIGTFTIAYDNAQKDDSWAYIRAARRVRRLAGSAWMDPIGGSDFNLDDIFGFNASPAWMPSIKLVEKRWLLVVANGDPEQKRWNQKGKTNAERFPLLDAEKPFWNVNDNWEPREVYVLELTLPPEHKGSKKLMYIDAKDWVNYYTTLYDRKGEVWKTIVYAQTFSKGGDGFATIEQAWNQIVDYQADHATVLFVPTDTYTPNPKDMKYEDVNLTKLEQAAAR